MMTQDFIKVVDTISGKGLAAIELAMPEFSKRGLSLDGYQVVVMEAGGKLVVLFKDAAAPTSQRGSTLSKPGFEVELNGNVVIRSNFVR